MAITGDSHMATSGDFFMATDIVYAEFYRFLGTMQHITTTMPKAPEAERFL